MSGPGLGEFGRIARYFEPLAAGAAGALGLVDDAAILETPLGRQLVTSVDAIVEGVHFLPDDAPDLIARKLLRVNLSDLAAMGAVPYGYLLTVALPASKGDDWVVAFTRGLAVDQAEFGLHLLGGDSVSTPGPVTLTATIFGSVEAGRALLRSGARPGDRIFVSGTLGDAALGLLVATWVLQLEDALGARFLADRYRLPQPRVGLGAALAGIACAAMDISDGLVADLRHVAAASDVAAIIHAPLLPLSDAAAGAIADNPELLMQVLTGGDDYELLFAVPPQAVAQAQEAARASGVQITEIGCFEAGTGLRVLDADGNELEFGAGGWVHG